MISLSLIDYVTLTLYIIIVVAIGIYFSRKHDSSVDYFLAGRNLSWWTIGGSLVASNISTESFVGMSGSGYKMGLAIACYDWLAAVGLIIVAKFLLPLFIKNRIYTMPEFLEIRYNHIVRFILSVMMIFGYVMIALAAVLYSGGLVIHTMFDFPLIWSIIVLAVVAGAYTVYGGLKAVVYTDIVQVITLLLGGIIATIIGLKAIGGIGSFWAQSSDKFHLVLPLDHPELPWIGVFVGLWIPNIFYWGCNQFITQRTLAAKNIHEAQIGVVFASFIKLIMPFIVVIPGIIAYALYSDEIPRADMAYPYLISRLVPCGLIGIIFAGLVGAIMSSLDSMLNSSATILTIDIYKRYINKNSSEKHLITVCRIAAIVVLVIAATIAPLLTHFELIFSYIQKFWGFISPGVVVVFLFGIFWKRSNASGAIASLVMSIPVYLALQFIFPDMAFLNQMTISFMILSLIMVIVSLSSEPFPERSINMQDYLKLIKTPRTFNILSGVIIGVVITFYAVFF